MRESSGCEVVDEPPVEPPPPPPPHAATMASDNTPSACRVAMRHVRTVCSEVACRKTVACTSVDGSSQDGCRLEVGKLEGLEGRTEPVLEVIRGAQRWSAMIFSGES